ncbi:hypothetical protein PG994_002236 [Apiospora phragmitis]|uniref:Uncharacterized protein n=1 Tax=Apiospora phragmitis TaxID=2905665 RepID=A0ABR1WVS6_9PEZI
MIGGQGWCVYSWDSQGTLELEISTVDLHSPHRPAYNCLSYTWGSPFLYDRHDPGDPARWREPATIQVKQGSPATSSSSGSVVRGGEGGCFFEFRWQRREGISEASVAAAKSLHGD